jgi:hypothetical protein
MRSSLVWSTSPLAVNKEQSFFSSLLHLHKHTQAEFCLLRDSNIERGNYLCS